MHTATIIRVMDADDGAVRTSATSVYFNETTRRYNLKVFRLCETENFHYFHSKCILVPK
jgi:hypothetical protein